MKAYCTAYCTARKRESSVDLVVDTAAPSRQSTSESDKEVYQEHNDQNQQDHQLDILPPHPPSQTSTPDSEIPGAISQPIRLIHQQINALAPLKHPLNILCHDLPNTIDFPLRSPERILFARLCRALLNHEFLERGVETRTAIARQRREIRIIEGKLLQKRLLHVHEKAEGDSSTEPIFGDCEVGETAGAGLGRRVFRRRRRDVVDEVLVVGVCEFLGLVVGDLGEDEGGER